MTRITECLLCAGIYIHGTTESPHSEVAIITFILQRRRPKCSRVSSPGPTAISDSAGLETRRGQLFSGLVLPSPAHRPLAAWPLESAPNGLPLTSAKGSLMWPLRALLRKAPGRSITKGYRTQVSLSHDRSHTGVDASALILDKVTGRPGRVLAELVTCWPVGHT